MCAATQTLREAWNTVGSGDPGALIRAASGKERKPVEATRHRGTSREDVAPRIHAGAVKRKINMRPTVLSLLLIGLCAGVSTLAIAQNVTAGDQPNADTQKAAPEVDPAKAKPGMNADETAVPAADSAAGKPAMTEDEAKPAKSDAANAEVWKAQYTAAKDKAQAVYKDAKTTCDTLEGGAKGSCMKNATSARTEA